MNYEPRFVLCTSDSLDSLVTINSSKRLSWRALWQPTIAKLVPRYQGDRPVGGEHHATFLGKGSYGYVVAAPSLCVSTAATT